MNQNNAVEQERLYAGPQRIAYVRSLNGLSRTFIDGNYFRL